MPKPHDRPKPPAEPKRSSPGRPPQGAQGLPIEELEKASRQASENGRKAPQKDL